VKSFQPEVKGCLEGTPEQGFDSGQVRLATSGFEKFLQKSLFFPSDKKISSGRVKKIPGSMTGWPLIFCGSEVCSGMVG